MPLIVLMEDDAATRMLVASVLKKDGYDVMSADNGAEGLLLVRAHQPDLVISDIQMPVMDGVAATRAIRALNDVRAAVPVIAVTANTLRSQLETYAAAGMNDWIEKPVNVAILVEKAYGWAAIRCLATIRKAAHLRSIHSKPKPCATSSSAIWS